MDGQIDGKMGKGRYLREEERKESGQTDEKSDIKRNKNYEQKLGKKHAHHHLIHCIICTLGVKWRQGMWSKEENDILKENIHQYCKVSKVKYYTMEFKKKDK